MVGRLRISHEAKAVRHFFIALEKNATKIKTCWFCGHELPTHKLANQGHLSGNHAPDCPLEKLATATEQCITLRHRDDEAAKQDAQNALLQSIEDFYAAMTEQVMPKCPFPVCRYAFEMGHRLGCPFHAFEREIRA